MFGIRFLCFWALYGKSSKWSPFSPPIFPILLFSRILSYLCTFDPAFVLLVTSIYVSLPCASFKGDHRQNRLIDLHSQCVILGVFRTLFLCIDNQKYLQKI